MKEAIAGLRHTPEVPARLRPRFMVKVEKQTRPQECAPCFFKRDGGGRGSRIREKVPGVCSHSAAA